MKLRINEVSSDLFTYHAASGTFTTEISDLGRGFRFQLLYDDAIDVGFAMKSSRTGAVITFYLLDAHVDAEGDVTHWTCKVTLEDERKHNLQGVTATIFND